MQNIGYPACDSIAEVFSYLSDFGPHAIIDTAHSCDDGFRYFLPTQPATVKPPAYSPLLVPYQIEFYRIDGSAAGLLVDFTQASNHSSYTAVPVDAVSSVPVFRYPSPWDTIREALSFGQSGHLPIALACLTYPGFSSWCEQNSDGSLLVQNVASDPSIVVPFPSRLTTRTRFVRWSHVIRDWAPQVLASLGYHGATNYLRNVSPIVQFGWQPYLCTGNVKPYPAYPGPLWYQNLNKCPDPDWILSLDALLQIQDECDSEGYNNPFGDLHMIPYVVAPVDDEGRAKVDFKFKLDALVVGGSQE